MKKAPAPTKVQGAFKDNAEHSPIALRIVKAFIVVAFLRGWLPFTVADWMICRGGLAHV